MHQARHKVSAFFFAFRRSQRAGNNWITSVCGKKKSFISVPLGTVIIIKRGEKGGVRNEKEVDELAT